MREDRRIAESQLSELRNMRVLLEEARLMARGLAYHRRAALEAVLGRAIDEVDRQIRGAARRGAWVTRKKASGYSPLLRAPHRPKKRTPV